MGNKFINVAIGVVIGVVTIPIVTGVLGSTGLSEASLTAYPGARSLIVIIPLALVASILWYAMKSMSGKQK